MNQQDMKPVMLVEWDQLAGCYGFVHLKAMFRLLDTDKRESTDTIYGELAYPSEYSEMAWLCSLCVWSQGKNDDQPRNLYGWSACYRNESQIELKDAERMVKTLRTIDRGMDKLKDEWGYADTYPEYLLRIAKVLKVKYMAFKNTAKRQESSGYTYQLREVGAEAKSSLDYLLKAWVDGNVEASLA